MTDFKVSPSALDSSAQAIASVGDGMTSLAESVPMPNPLQYGVLCASAVMPMSAAYTGSRLLLRGMGQTDKSMSETLSMTAQAYQACEEAAVALCHEFVGGF